MNYKYFKNSNYMKLLLATVITRFGDAMDSIALSWLVYIMTGSKVLMGTLFAVSFIPNLITLPFAGVIADIISKKKLSVLSDLGRGISVSAMALIYYFGYLEVWHLFLFIIINSFMESFANPARTAILPLIIEEDHYVTCSSYLTSSTTLGELVGIGLVGVIISSFGVWFALLIDGFTFFLSAIITLSICFKEKSSIVNKTISFENFINMIKEGFLYVGKNKLLVNILLLAGFINFSFVPYNVLMPVYVKEVLNTGVEGMSFLGISLLIGILVGSIVIAKVGNKLNPVTAISFGLALMGMNYALMGLPHYISLKLISPISYASILSFFFGFFLPFAQTPIKALMMKSTDKEILGRLSSIFSLVSLSATPIGGALVGILGKYIDVSTLFIIMGASGFVVSLVFCIKTRSNLVKIEI
ncbi:MFS transporter [Clostridium sediminicola]|uniref:MFS transporter n=1 Tax=Clostridium sediminicola TaxID=3114879 RepID=UPI0031F24917